MHNKFELGHNAAEATKIICEIAVDYRKIIWWFKHFHSGCKSVDDLARSGKPKTEILRPWFKP